MNRREAVGILSLGLATDFFVSKPSQAWSEIPSPLLQEPPQSTSQTANIIRSVSRDIQLSDLSSGPILFHEHLSAQFSPTSTRFRNDVDMMIREVRVAKDAGISCIVDAGHPDILRSLAALLRIDRETGLPIVASGGFYMERTYPPDLAGKSSEEIAQDLIKEAREQHLGAFGEIGQQKGTLTASERKVFRAIALAHLETRLPIYTHNPYIGRRNIDSVPADAALHQLDLLEQVGVPSQNIALGHMCCLDDPQALVAITAAKRGAYIGFDRVTLTGIMPDTARVKMAMAVIEAGFSDRLLLSSDFAVEDALFSRGGPGLAQTATVFAPLLKQAGLSDEILQQILVDNPRNFLAFSPRT